MEKQKEKKGDKMSYTLQTIPGENYPLKPYELPGELDPGMEAWQPCEWHLLIRHLSKKRIKACRLDITPCPEEGTGEVWTEEREYCICPKHKREWDGLKEN